MSTQNLFASSFQGGPLFDVLSAQGADPAANWKLSSPAIKKVFDKNLKGNVFVCEGGPQTFMQLPKEEKMSLSLTQPCLVLQILVPGNQPFSLELSVVSVAKAKRRLHFSTVFKEVSATPLHAKIPLSMIRRNMWMNFCLDVGELHGSLFKEAFRSIEMIMLHSACHVRRVFTLRSPPADTSEVDDLVNGDSAIEVFTQADTIPRTHAFPTGVEYVTCVVNYERVLRVSGGASTASSAKDEATHKAKASVSTSLTHIAFGQRVAVPSTAPAAGSGSLSSLAPKPPTPKAPAEFTVTPRAREPAIPRTAVSRPTTLVKPNGVPSAAANGSAASSGPTLGPIAGGGGAPAAMSAITPKAALAPAAGPFELSGHAVSGSINGSLLNNSAPASRLPPPRSSRELSAARVRPPPRAPAAADGSDAVALSLGLPEYDSRSSIRYNRDDDPENFDDDDYEEETGDYEEPQLPPIAKIPPPETAVSRSSFARDANSPRSLGATPRRSSISVSPRDSPRTAAASASAAGSAHASPRLASLQQPLPDIGRMLEATRQAALAVQQPVASVSWRAADSDSVRYRNAEEPDDSVIIDSEGPPPPTRTSSLQPPLAPARPPTTNGGTSLYHHQQHSNGPGAGGSGNDNYDGIAEHGAGGGAGGIGGGSSVLEDEFRRFDRGMQNLKSKVKELSIADDGHHVPHGLGPTGDSSPRVKRNIKVTHNDVIEHEAIVPERERKPVRGVQLSINTTAGGGAADELPSVRVEYRPPAEEPDSEGETEYYTQSHDDYVPEVVINDFVRDEGPRGSRDHDFPDDDDDEDDHATFQSMHDDEDEDTGQLSGSDSG